MRHSFILLPVFGIVVYLLAFHPGKMLGGPKDVKGAENSAEVEELGRFAVDEHNAKEDTTNSLSFVELVSASQQVVQGKLYTIIVKATSNGQAGHYEAKVWTKPWENHKSLESFKPLGPGLTAADMGKKSGSRSNELRDVPKDDPAVLEAIEFALKSLQEKSNSLVPYELQGLDSAQAEESEEGTSFHLKAKLLRGKREEHLVTHVHCDDHGKLTVKSSSLQQE